MSQTLGFPGSASSLWRFDCLSVVYFSLFLHFICFIFPWCGELYKVNSMLSIAVRVGSSSASKEKWVRLKCKITGKHWGLLVVWWVVIFDQWNCKPKKCHFYSLNGYALSGFPISGTWYPCIRTETINHLVDGQMYTGQTEYFLECRSDILRHHLRF